MLLSILCLCLRAPSLNNAVYVNIVSQALITTARRLPKAEDRFCRVSSCWFSVSVFLWEPPKPVLYTILNVKFPPKNIAVQYTVLASILLHGLKLETCYFSPLGLLAMLCFRPLTIACNVQGSRKDIKHGGKFTWQRGSGFWNLGEWILESRGSGFWNPV